MKKPKTLIYLKDNHGEVQGPFTPKAVAKLFHTANGFVQWIWFESKGDWNSIDIALLDAQLEQKQPKNNRMDPTMMNTKMGKQNNENLETKHLRYAVIQNIEALCKVKGDIFPVELDQIDTHGCMLFGFGKQVKPHMLTPGSTVQLNLIDVQKQISENVKGTLGHPQASGKNQSQIEVHLRWQAMPEMFKSIASRRK